MEARIESVVTACIKCQDLAYDKTKCGGLKSEETGCFRLNADLPPGIDLLNTIYEKCPRQKCVVEIDEFGLAKVVEVTE